MFGESSFPRQPCVCCSCNLVWQRRWELPPLCFIRAPIPTTGTLPSCPQHLPKAPPSNTITWGLGCQCIKWRDTRIWTTASCCKGLWEPLPAEVLSAALMRQISKRKVATCNCIHMYGTPTYLTGSGAERGNEVSMTFELRMM